MSLPYEEFATWILSDLARRVRSNYLDRIVFLGNRISRQLVLPIRAPREPEEEYKERVKSFRRSLPRASDFSLRIALAFRALTNAGYKHLAAAQFVLQELEREAEWSCAIRKEYARYRIAYQPLKYPLGTTKRHLRRRPKKARLSLEDPRLETVRTQALRFIRKHPDFDRLFETAFQTFRSEYCRDPEWCAQAEGGFRQQLTAIEAELGPTDQWTALTTGNLARFLHEQGKFEV